MDEGSALLSMDEQEEAFIDTSTSNGNSPGEGYAHQSTFVRCQLLVDALHTCPLPSCHQHIVCTILCWRISFTILSPLYSTKVSSENSLVLARHEVVVTCRLQHKEGRLPQCPPQQRQLLRRWMICWA